MLVQRRPSPERLNAHNVLAADGTLLNKVSSFTVSVENVSRLEGDVVKLSSS